MLKNIVKKYLQGCVMLVTTKDKKFSFVCSAFICSNKGYLLTCAHAIDLSQSLYIALPLDTSEFRPEKAGSFRTVRVNVAQFDPINDVALLKVDDTEIISLFMPPPSSSLASEEQISLGASVGIFGYPFGSRGQQIVKVSSGTVSSKVLTPGGTRRLQIETIINDGSSGGPLIDVESECIIGIISGIFSPNRGFPGIFVGGTPTSLESNISYATGMSYGIALLVEEGIYE